MYNFLFYLYSTKPKIKMQFPYTRDLNRYRISRKAKNSSRSFYTIHSGFSDGIQYFSCYKYIFIQMYQDSWCIIEYSTYPHIYMNVYLQVALFTSTYLHKTTNMNCQFFFFKQRSMNIYPLACVRPFLFLIPRNPAG